MERGNPETRRRIETQLLHYDGQQWAAYSYRWNDAQTDAELVPSRGAEALFEVKDPAIPNGVRRQTWRYFSRAECLRCHTDLSDPFPPAIAVLLYRATEEALRSLPAHEQAKPVTVRVSGHDHFATLDVVDHGDVERGIAAPESANGHAGVRALTDLVADAGGRLLVEAADNGGTRVHVEVPLP